MGAFEKPVDKATVLAGVKPFLTQMSTMPAGAPETGGGSMAPRSSTGFIVGGAAALGVAAWPPIWPGAAAEAPTPGPTD